MSEPVQQFPHDYPETLLELCGCIAGALQQLGVPKQKAENDAFLLAEAIRSHFGGQHVYIPRGDDYERARRNAVICAAFNGNNYVALGRQYDLSPVQVRSIVKGHRAKQQKALF